MKCDVSQIIAFGAKLDSSVRTAASVYATVGASPYRVLIESMNEGALTVTVDKTILYANQCFARMVKYPLEQVTGGSFRRFLSVEDRALLRPLMKRAAKSGSKIQVLLHASDGSLVPALLSIRELANEGSQDVIIGMVVTNMTEARRNEEMLRALTHRVVQVQEAERGRVALELHDHITQPLCAILVRCQTLAAPSASRHRPARSLVPRSSRPRRRPTRSEPSGVCRPGCRGTGGRRS
jgi:PAS domain S-box-containing protein